MSSSFDASIPVLTEILHASGCADVNAELEAELTAELTTEAPASDQSILELAASATAEPMPDEPSDQKTLEQQLSERMFLQLEQRITVALEQRMADVLHHALLGLGQQIRDGLHMNIEQIVAQEVAQLKADIHQQ